MSEKLLTTREAARYLHVSEASIRRWTDAGLLPAGRVGFRKARRFKEADLARFAERQDARSPKTTPAIGTVRLHGREIPVGNHLASFYGSDSGSFHQALPVLVEGIAADEPCLLFATPELHERYAEAMREQDVDLKAAIERGVFAQITVARKTPEAWIASLETLLTEVLRHRPGPVRFLAEVTAGLESTGSLKALVQQEWLLTSLVKRFPVVLLCLYDVRKFDGPMILEALKLHYDTFEHGFGYFLS
jgi:excisionase family DNA binding protein